MADFRRKILGAGALVLALLIPGCGGGDDPARREELQALLEAGQAEELEARVTLYREKEGESALLSWYEGAAHLAQDEDIPAERAFEAAVAADSSLAPATARRWREAAQRDEAQGWTGRAVHRMQRAYRLDGLVEMGRLGPEVAKYLFDNGILEPLLPLYRHLLAGGTGEPTDRQRWRFRLGRTLEGLDLPEAALREYRTYWSEWDWETGEWNSFVVYRHAVVLLELADERAERGDAAGALSLVDEVLGIQAHREHRIEARFRKGLYLEQLGRFQEALGWYEKVAEDTAGEAVRAEDARERIEALRAMGVH